MTVSNEAVEAAARAIYEQNPCGEQDFDADFRPIGPGYVIKFDALPEYDAGLYELSLNQARAALEAAAPHMLQANEGMAATAQGNVMDRPVEIISENPDVCFIEAALSWYDGGPAGDDVRQSWSRLKDIIHAPHLYPASGEVGEAVKRLTDCATNEKAHWSLLPDAGACVDVPVSDLRAVLSALSEATERAGRMEREADQWRSLAAEHKVARRAAEAKVKELEAPFDWTAEDLVDLMAEAIMDAVDLDTNATDYARAALEALNKEGLLRSNDSLGPDQ